MTSAGTETAVPQDPLSRRLSAHRGGNRSMLAMVAATIVAALVRLPVVMRAGEPGIVPDEPGYWAIARWISGSGFVTRMNDLPIYQPVQGALLAPLELVPVSPSARYRLALALTFASIVLAAGITRHLIGTLGGGELASTTGFVVVVLYPALVVTGSFTWPESTVLVFSIAFVAGLAHVNFDRGGTSTAVLLGTGTIAGLAPFVHGRLTGLLPIWLCVLAWSASAGAGPGRTRLGWGRAAGSAVTALSCAAGALLVRSRMVESLYSGGFSAGGAVTGVILDPGRWPDILWAAAGQLWYAVVSSAGLCVLGVAALLHWLGRGDRSRRPFSAAVLAMIASVWLISGTFMAGAVARVGQSGAGRLSAVRWDHLYYGRYLDPMVLIATVAGACALLRAGWRDPGAGEPDPAEPARIRSQLVLAGAGAVALGAGLWIKWHGAPVVSPVDPNVAGVAAMGIPEGPFRIPLATAVSLGLMALWWVLAPHRSLLIRFGMFVLVLGAFGASGSAVTFHSSFSFSGMYDDVPTAAPDRDEAVVAGDAEIDPSAKLNWPGQQMMLGGRGWHFRFTDQDSETVAQDPGEDVGLLALTGGVGDPSTYPGEWRRVGAAGGVSIWFRGSG